MTKLNEVVKTNEEMHAEFEDALNLVSEKAEQLLKHGNFRLERVLRDYKSNELESAVIFIGKHRIRLQANSSWPNNKNGTEITVALPKNPISQKEMDAYDIQIIGSDIGYHRGMVNELVKRKEELLKRYRESEQLQQLDGDEKDNVQ